MASKSGGKNPAITKRGRFNPNITLANHAGCILAQRSKIDKEKDRLSRRTIVFVSKAISKDRG